MIDRDPVSIDNLSPTRPTIPPGDARTVYLLVLAYNGLSSVRLIEVASQEGLTLPYIKAGRDLRWALN